jgi:hypothetical protein
MNTLDFVTIELRARKLHDAEVRRLFGLVGHALSEALHQLLHGLHPAPGPHAPKRFA